MIGKKYSLLVASIIILSPMLQYASGATPTHIFASVSTSNGTTTAPNYKSDLHIKGAGLVTIYTGSDGSVIVSSSAGAGTIQGSQNVGKGTGSFGVLSTASSTTIKGKNITAGTGISLSGNTTDITITNTVSGSSGPAPKVSINGNNRSSFIGIVANQTFAAPKIVINGNNRSSFISVANTTSANSISGHLVSFPSSNSGTLLLQNGTGAYLTENVRGLTAGAGISLNDSSGTVQVTSTATGTVTGSQNVGKATGSVGTLSTASSTIIKGRNFTGTSPISITKTNDTDVSVSCPSCLSSALLTTQNIGKGTGSFGVLSTPTSSIVKGKNMTAGSGISLSGNTTDITITSTATGTLTTTQNIGKGTGSLGFLSTPTATIVKSKNATAGTGISLSGNTTDITFTNTGIISASGVSGNTTVSGTNPLTINTSWNIPLLNGIETFLNTVTFNTLKLGGQMDLNGQTMKSSGHVYTWPSNTGTVLLANGSGASLTGIVLSSLNNAGHVSTAPLNTGTILDTNGSLSTLTGTLLSTIGVTTLSNAGHVSTFPSNTGTILDTNGTGAYLTQNVRAIAAGTNIAVNGTTGTVSISVTGVPTLSGNNIWTGTNQWTSSGALYENPAKTFATTLSGAAVTANSTLNLPLITGTDTLGALGLGQSWSAKNTFTGNVDFTDTGTAIYSFDSSGPVIRNPAKTFGTTIANGAQLSNQSLSIPVIREGETIAVRPQTSSATNATVQTTSSATLVFAGRALTITPQVTGNIMVYYTGYASDGTVLDGCTLSMREGTGTAPKAGAAVSGNAVGINIIATSATANANVPFGITYPLTGLAVGTTAWFEPVFSNAIGGTCSLRSTMIVLQEY